MSYVEKLGLKFFRENHRPKKTILKLDLKLGSQDSKFLLDQFPARPLGPEVFRLRH